MNARAQAVIAARALQRCARVVNAERRRAELELVVLYQRDPATHDVVVAAFRPLAGGIAKRYHRGEEPLEDLEQVALLGLIKALERFDTQRGAPFATYAIPTMTGEVRRHFRDTGWAVHVNRSAQEMAQKLAALERGTDRALTVAECAQRLGVDEERVVAGRLAARAMRTDSLDRPLTGNDPDADALRYAPGEVDEGYAAAEHRATIARLTDRLPEREKAILALRFGGDMTQAEIGEQVGLSQMHVSRLLRRSLATLSDAG